MSLASIYDVVKGKDELLCLVQFRYFTRILETAEDTIRPALDPLGRLERFIQHHVTYFANHMAEMKVGG